MGSRTKSLSRSRSRSKSFASSSHSASSPDHSWERRAAVSRSPRKRTPVDYYNDYSGGGGGRSKGGRGRSRSHSSHRYRKSPRSRSRSPYSPPARRRGSTDHHRRRSSYSRSPYSSRRRHSGGGGGGGGGVKKNINPQQSRCLGVFGLNVYTTQTQIIDIFSKFGAIDRVQVIIDAKSGRSRGYCFVYYENIEDAKLAKDACCGMELEGRRIRVDYSITQRPHTPTPGVYMGKPTRRDREYHGGGGGGSSSGRYRNDDDDYGYDRPKYSGRRSPLSPYRGGNGSGSGRGEGGRSSRRYERTSRSRSRSSSYSPKERKYR